MSVFDLMGRTEETELRISHMIDQLFQVSLKFFVDIFGGSIMKILVKIHTDLAQEIEFVKKQTNKLADRANIYSQNENADLTEILILRRWTQTVTGW